MGWTLLLCFIALLVGWATPAPLWAETFTTWAVAKWDSIVNKDDDAPGI
jgi:hypothetical protein